MAKKPSLRMCVVCRTMKPKPELLRVVATPDGIVPDTSGRLNGRGAYLCLDGSCIEAAVKTRRLNGALRAKASEDLGERLAEVADARRRAMAPDAASEPRVRRVHRIVPGASPRAEGNDD